MVLVRQFCCGVALRKGTFIIIYLALAREVITFLALIAFPTYEIIRDETNSTRYTHILAVVINLIVVGTALYGVYKHRALLMIPFLAYRTVSLVFGIFPLMNAREIANTVNESLENGLNNERDETFDTMPFVVLSIVLEMCIECYFLLTVYSYYQLLLMSATMVAVAVPVASSYTVPPYDMSVYSQPPVNPHLFETKNPYQYHESHPTPPDLQYYAQSTPMSNAVMMVNSMPPPYRP